MVDRLKLTHLYTIPTVIKFLMKAGNGHVDKYNLSSLKVLALGNNCLCTTLILDSVIDFGIGRNYFTTNCPRPLGNAASVASV